MVSTRTFLDGPPFRPPSAAFSPNASAIVLFVNSKHRKTLEAVWAEPANGNLERARIEALLVALGCRVMEGPGSSVTFDWQGRKASFHRPHPNKEALRYRVKAAREFLQHMGVTS